MHDKNQQTLVWSERGLERDIPQWKGSPSIRTLRHVWLGSNKKHWIQIWFRDVSLSIRLSIRRSEVFFYGDGCHCFVTTRHWDLALWLLRLFIPLQFWICPVKAFRQICRGQRSNWHSKETSALSCELMTGLPCNDLFSWTLLFTIFYL